MTLNVGDQLEVTLSWPGDEDLDLYLYKDSEDLLDRDTYQDREFSPIINPEIM